MTSEVKPLSERQHYWLEHLRAADEQQISLAGYAREQGLGLKQLYGAKTWLIKLGHWPRGVVRSSPSDTALGNEFVAVRTSTTLSNTGSKVCCVVRHVSGWRVECDALPSTEWLNALVRGAVHASA